jgi:hypothetical protein
VEPIASDGSPLAPQRRPLGRPRQDAYKAGISQHLNHAIDALESGRAVLAAALDLLGWPRDLYRTAANATRKILDKAIFTRLHPRQRRPPASPPRSSPHRRQQP